MQLCSCAKKGQIQSPWSTFQSFFHNSLPDCHEGKKWAWPLLQLLQAAAAKSKLLLVSSLLFLYNYHPLFRSQYTLKFLLTKVKILIHSSEDKTRSLLDFRNTRGRWSVRRREFNDWASCSHSPHHRWSFPPDLHVSHVGFRIFIMRPPLVFKPVLLVPQRASLCYFDFGPDRSAAFGLLHGQNCHQKSLLQGTKVGIHAKSWSVQC